MGVKLVLTVAAVVLVLAGAIEARRISYRAHADNDDEQIVASVAGRHPHPDSQRSVSPQGRVFPGAIAIKKLVLLKFKKIIPISLILLKSSNENEAELVPVYPTSEIPPNVQFIPTPNGISGHKDVQAIAIPTELHQQLELNGLANLESIEALLNDAEEETSGADENTVVITDMKRKENTVVITDMKRKEDEPLNVKEEDEDQLLDAVAADKPTKLAVSGVRRLAAEDVARPGLRTSHHTTVEEIPLFLYSAKDTPQAVYSGRKTVRHHANSGRRQHA